MVTREGSRPASAEQRLKELGIKLPAPPEPFGTHVEAVQTGNLLFLTGMLPTDMFGKDKNPCRLVYGVASLPLGTPVELEIILEVSA
jgi:enamine deaminase RidA (YjgF/YER057c/UK114 family)